MGKWFNDNEKYYHRSHHFRRKKHTFLWIILIIILFVAIAYAYDIGGIKTSISKINLNLPQNSQSSNSYAPVLIKDLNQNPQNYVGKSIRISGVMWTNYAFQDSNGYYVSIGSDNNGAGCVESQRVYDYYHTQYSVEGVWNGHTLICSKPIA